MTLRRVLALLGLVLAIVGFAAFTAISVVVWSVGDEVVRRAELVLGEAAQVVGKAQPVAKTIGETITVAEAEVKAAVRPAAPALAGGGITGRLLRSALNETPGRVQSASRAADAMGDLLVVARVALDAVQDNPAALPLNVADIDKLKKQVDEASKALHSADAILRSPTAGTSDAIAAEDARLITNALAQSQSVLGEVVAQLNSIEANVSVWRRELPLRIRRVQWAIFALAVLGAVGQVALFSCCWRHLRVPRGK